MLSKLRCSFNNFQTAESMEVSVSADYFQESKVRCKFRTEGKTFSTKSTFYRTLRNKLNQKKLRQIDAWNFKISPLYRYKTLIFKNLPVFFFSTMSANESSNKSLTYQLHMEIFLEKIFYINLHYLKLIISRLYQYSRLSGTYILSNSLKLHHRIKSRFIFL